MASTAPQPSQQQEEMKPLSKPFRSWWNPNLPWLDLFANWVASFFMPLSNVARLESSSIKARQVNNDTQTKFVKNMDFAFRSTCRKWSKACGGLVQCTWNVPRRAELLYEWAIIDENDELLKQVLEKESSEEDKFVTVRIWCPASLVSKEGDDRTENDYGCIEVDTLSLHSIPRNVPVLLWFHGGGLTLGSCDDDIGVSYALDVLEKQKQVSDSDMLPPMVVASVEYRLAPKHPLPAALIDALSALDYCLKDDPERAIHVGGMSAGVYTAVVSKFASHRQYPGRVQSSFLVTPFLSPAADSVSYYMNGWSSPLVTNPWIRWCWRAALGMNDCDLVKETETDDILAVGSNRTAWNKSKWKQNEQWHNFLEPMQGIPAGLDKPENGNKFVVAVNKADPLHDDGRELMLKLKKAGADVKYVEALGSHAFGFILDRKKRAELVEAWRSVIF